MEEISFENPIAKQIYHTTLSQAETTDGRERIDIMFHTAATVDGNTELSQKEAQKIKDALTKYDRGILLSLGINYRRYDDQEINQAWQDKDIFVAPLSSKEWQYLKSLNTRFSQTLINRFLPLFLSGGEDGKKILTYYQELANHPKTNIGTLANFLFNVEDMYNFNYPLNKETGKVRGEFDLPGFNLEGYSKFWYSGMEAAARVIYEALVFEYDLNPKFSENFQDLSYLEEAAKSNNRLLAHKALIQLGIMQKGRDLIIDIIRTGRSDALFAAFGALSYFEDEQTTGFLVDILLNGPFDYLNYARRALANYAVPKIVIKQLETLLDSHNAFARGEAASLLKYFIGRAGFEDFKKSIKSKLAKLSKNKSEDPLIKAVVNETLKLLNSQTSTLLALPEQMSNHVYTSFFFRYPKQLNWIVEAVRKKALTVQESSEEIRALSIGSSTGMEPLSIIMAILEDYENDPPAWGNFNPRKRFKVIATDIDLDALLYLKRGEYHGSFLNANELDGFEKYTKFFGAQGDRLLNKYFDCNYSAGKFRFKDEYRDMLQIRQLDITQGDETLNNKSFIVVYNNVSSYLGSKHRKILAVEQLFALSQEYITYAVDSSDFITLGLLTLREPVYQMNNIGLVKIKP